MLNEAGKFVSKLRMAQAEAENARVVMVGIEKWFSLIEPRDDSAWQFADWCRFHGILLARVKPMVVRAYVEELTKKLAPASVKQNLAAIRMLFDWLVVGQIVPFNPASSVRGPTHVVKRSKTSVLAAEERIHI